MQNLLTSPVDIIGRVKENLWGSSEPWG